MEGRAVLDALVGPLERIAIANEKLIELATEERSLNDLPGPPFCPHCGRFNPLVRSEGGQGQFAEYVLIANCKECQNTFYAISDGWQVFQSPEQASTYLEGRTAQ